MRIAVSIEYNGASYSGWQTNGDNKTICFELERAFEKVFGSKIKIVASGRTDAGVHAYNQVAHFDLPKNCTISTKNIPSTVNKVLPSDIRITSAKEVSDRFHARYNVKSKTYLYKCYTAPVSSPLREGFFLHYPAVLNMEKMKECVNLLVGKHDFRAFCLNGGDNETFEREVLSIDIVRKKDEIYFFVKGKGFLYSMVRLIVGTLLLVGQGKLSIEQVKIALTEGDKRFVGEKVSACGLYLYSVEY